MSLRTFILGLIASFGIAWLLVLVVPFVSMRSVPAVPLDAKADGKAGIYFPKRAGRTVNGALVYAANGCNQCHSQLVRPTYRRQRDVPRRLGRAGRRSGPGRHPARDQRV